MRRPNLKAVRSPKTPTNRSHATGFFLKLCFSWALLLPLLVPFESFRNIELQGLVLMLAGACAWLVILLDKTSRPKLGKSVRWLLLIIISFCILATMLTPHPLQNLLGAPYFRLGSLGLISCIGIGLLASKFPAQKIGKSLYFAILVIAISSLLYSLLRPNGTGRLGGVFSQADIFACIIGVGIVLGWQFCTWRNWRGRNMVAAQLCLLALLFISQTRACILLTLLLSLVWLYQSKLLRLRTYTALCTAILVTGFCFMLLTPSFRLNDVKDASYSTNYRLELAKAGVHASLHRPIFGYGPGNLADALDCRSLHAKPLQKTCSDGYFFNSSHNIYLDRTLAYGWLAGLAFLLLILLSVLRPGRFKPLGLATIFIALYYCTNVTSIPVELLLWVLVLKGLQRETPDSK